MTKIWLADADRSHLNNYSKKLLQLERYVHFELLSFLLLKICIFQIFQTHCEHLIHVDLITPGFPVRELRKIVPWTKQIFNPFYSQCFNLLTCTIQLQTEFHMKSSAKMILPFEPPQVRMKPKRVYVTSTSLVRLLNPSGVSI